MATEVATHRTQRQAEIAAAAAAISIAISPAKVAAHETLIAAMYREIVRVDNWLSDPVNQTNEMEWQAQTDYLSQLMDAIVDLPSQGPMDFIYKMMGHTANGEHCPCCGSSETKIWAEAYALIGAGTAHMPPPSAEDPVLPLFREWVAARRTWYDRIEGPDGDDTWSLPDTKDASAQENTAYNALLHTTPTTLAGIAALAVVLWDLASHDIPPGVPIEALHLPDEPALRLIAAIWRAASGRDGFPPSSRMEGVL